MVRPTTPVLVGVSQILQRVEPPEAKPPLALMIDAVRSAAEDAEAPRLLSGATSVRVVKGIWGYKNPAHQIMEAIGCGAVETGLSVLGGNHVQMMLNQSALDIQAGRRDIVILTGAECGRSIGRSQKAGTSTSWLEESDNDGSPDPDVIYGDSRWTRHEAEMARGIERPVHYYSMFENALRYQAGESVEQHQIKVSELWAAFSRVAQDNPNAWIRKPVTAEEIRTLSPSNRPITFPYPKLMNANMRVDMAAALILCSQGTADALSIPEEKRIYPLSGTDAYDHYFVSERANLHSSPAIRIAGGRALELAEVAVTDLKFVDLYSCFPSAVQVAATELGLSQERPLTVTGGLTFGGGPLNNYVMHSIARTVELLRDSADERALVTANGGMLTKHSFGVYSSLCPAQEFRHENLQAEVDSQPKREVVVDHEGAAEIESYTVNFGAAAKRASGSFAAIYGQASAATGSEPSVAYLACLLPDGRRTWARLDNPEVLELMCSEEFCGRSVSIDGQGNAKLS